RLLRGGYGSVTAANVAIVVVTHVGVVRTAAIAVSRSSDGWARHAFGLTARTLDHERRAALIHARLGAVAVALLPGFFPVVAADRHAVRIAVRVRAWRAAAITVCRRRNRDVRADEIALVCTAGLGVRGASHAIVAIGRARVGLARGLTGFLGLVDSAVA